MQQLSDRRLDVKRVVSEGDELDKRSTTARASTSAELLESKYCNLVDIAEVSQ